MMMDLAMGHRANLPGKEAGPGTLYLTRSIKEVGLDGVIGRIAHATPSAMNEYRKIGASGSVVTLQTP